MIVADGNVFGCVSGGKNVNIAEFDEVFSVGFVVDGCNVL